MENYKEKYEAAIERAKKELEAYDSQDCDAAKQILRIFPELKESEDEITRKELTKFLKDASGGYIHSTIQCKTFGKWLAWLEKQGNKTIVTPQWMIDFLDELRRHFGTPMDYDERKEVDGKLLCIKEWLEKQGEQKLTRPVWKYKKDNTPLLRDSFILNKYGCVANSPSGALVSDVWVLDFDELAKLPKEDFERENEQKIIDKIEPKFKVGDWCIDNEDDTIYQIMNVLDNTYTYKTNEGKEYSCSHYSIENDAHLWTIKDAKDGDVLMANAPFIFNGNLEGGIGCPGAHCGINTLGKFQIPKYPEHWTGHTTTPATKEQRDLLFQKMEEAGYKWNVVEKKLVKLP